VLKGAGVVHSVSSGRENPFSFEPGPIEELRTYLDLVSQQWNQALARLRSFVES
jgi:hypothetical protein